MQICPNFHRRVETLHFQLDLFGSVQTPNSQKQQRVLGLRTQSVQPSSPDRRRPPQVWAHSKASGRPPTLSAAGSGWMGPCCGSRDDKGNAIRQWLIRHYRRRRRARTRGEERRAEDFSLEDTASVCTIMSGTLRRADETH